MQRANIMVALGGDRSTTVPKYGVTASEIAVLRAVHGMDAVFDIDPIEDEKRSDREELARLGEIYGRTKIQAEDGEVFVLRALFPGANARLIQTLDELALDESLFKPTDRVKLPKAEKASKTRKKADEPADDEPVNVLDE